MENVNKIKALLDRYYNGETTLEEEQQLEQYFRKSDIPESFSVDKELFLALADDAPVMEIPGDLDEKIMNTIDRAENKEIKTRRISWFSLSGLAAGLLILISVFLFFMKDNHHGSLADKTMEDTFDDPRDAYEEARRTLAYVATKFNEGTSELKHIGKVNSTVENLQPLAFINKGNKEIRLLKQLEKADQIKRQ
ncbi:MAG: hypothetical protein JXA39_06205 [Bacteroidales bacterium]|nr:hypothetical protein [Bacteroidales bacterium]